MSVQEESAEYREGFEAGQNAAEWWIQENIGGRASGNVKSRAHEVLKKMDDNDTDDLGFPQDDRETFEDDDFNYSVGFTEGLYGTITKACREVLDIEES